MNIKEQDWNEYETELKIELGQPQPVITVGIEKIRNH